MLRALITGAFVSLMNACVAGECWSSRLRTRPAWFSKPLLGRAGRLGQASKLFPSTGVLYVPRGVQVDCVSLLNQTLSSSSFEVYQCCGQVFQR